MRASVVQTREKPMRIGTLATAATFLALGLSLAAGAPQPVNGASAVEIDAEVDAALTRFDEEEPAAGTSRAAEILMFMSQEALELLRSSDGWTARFTVVKVGGAGEIDTNMLSEPVIGFLFSEHGLMANLSLKGPRLPSSTGRRAGLSFRAAGDAVVASGRRPGYQGGDRTP
jgi:hypothetical protein